MSGNLLDSILVSKSADYAAAGTTEVAGAALDMAGFDGVIFIAAIGTANAGNYLQADEGDTSSPTAALAGSSVVAGSDGDVVVLEVHKPLKRYIRPTIIRGASTVTQTIYAIRYKGRKAPQTSGDVRVKLISPLAA